ncbi:beta:beta-carotene 9':10'-oxygenase-like protein, partial [Leptotrombidium deliense]
MNDSDDERKCEIMKMIYLRNCNVECPKMKATVKGIIPTWINGSLIRNGPGLYKIANDEYQHLFDYPSLIHKFSIQNGEIFYENKFLKSAAYFRNKEMQRIVVTEFGTKGIPDPCKSLLSRFMSRFSVDNMVSDNVAINIINIGDDVYAAGDTVYLTKIDPKNLNTIERNKLVS